MTRLLSAGFLRLKKNKVFWGGLILMAAWGIFMPVKMHLDAVQMGYVYRIEDGFFVYAMGVGVVMAVFCSLFIGTDYHPEQNHRGRKTFGGLPGQRSGLLRGGARHVRGVSAAVSLRRPAAGGRLYCPGGDGFADDVYDTAPLGGGFLRFHLYRHGLPVQVRCGCDLHIACLRLPDDRDGAGPDTWRGRSGRSSRPFTTSIPAGRPSSAPA